MISIDLELARLVNFGVKHGLVEEADRVYTINRLLHTLGLTEFSAVEAPEEEAPRVRDLVKEEMESAVSLAVPMEVDAKVGESIREMEQRITKGLSAGQVQMFLELIEQMSRNLEN